MPALIDAKGRERFLRDAHVITSVAGMLGFKDLSGCCANLLTLQSDDEAGFAIIEERTGLARVA